MYQINTSRPSSRTLRVLKCTSLNTVVKSLVQNIKTSLKPLGRMNFSSSADPEPCSIQQSTVSESMEGKTEIDKFGGRLRGAPTKTRICCNSGCTPILEEYVGAEGKDSTVVEHLIERHNVMKNKESHTQ